ncbi:hypothetical protein TPY_3468 [Sulfobacillus acidophilus TPY]|nr:hypothetical protein TPY_3468 [Sulfobacillus acidophilus TPY]
MIWIFRRFYVAGRNPTSAKTRLGGGFFCREFLQHAISH